MGEHRYRQHPLDFAILEDNDIARARAANADGVAPKEIYAMGDKILAEYELVKAGNYGGRIINPPWANKPEAEALSAAYILWKRNPASDKHNQRKLIDCRKKVMSCDIATRQIHMGQAYKKYNETKATSAKLNLDKIKAICKAGQKYQLGNHTLFCGDNKAIKEVESADLMITDPPYLIDYQNTLTGKHASVRVDIKGDKNRKFEMGQHLLKHPGRNAYIFFASSKIVAVANAVERAGWEFTDTLIWDKGRGGLDGRMDYKQDKEMIAYVKTKGRQHRNPKELLSSLMRIKRNQKNHYHPTEKPIILIERIILNHSRQGDVILDPFLGGGSTLLACENTGRKCVGIEMEGLYCDRVIARWEKLTGRKAKLISEAAKPAKQ